MLMQRYWRSISSCSHLGGTKRGFVSSTIPKSAAAATKTDMNSTGAKLKSRADLFPIYILLGFTGGAVFLAVRSVTMQLFHHPGVQVNKTNRSMMPEVDSPDSALASGDKFISKSVLRKVAHIQKRDDAVPMDGTANIYKTRFVCDLSLIQPFLAFFIDYSYLDKLFARRSSDSTNLKTVGVEPRANRG
ncbi:hypothetical protein L2E82_13415 [Cichorium intybus]|uniref:Uncharacterized protein n=1 Tax=Cichorium intybus TaxID=13427 RepID=A0ACB9EWS6_CICIN|nr:hypothetical protein L1887_33107 [Cichorium endivia]KAI3763508.1 hypothetical protein L2E82_13415 [Cichorium intybus]